MLALPSVSVLNVPSLMAMPEVASFFATMVKTTLPPGAVLPGATLLLTEMTGAPTVLMVVLFSQPSLLLSMVLGAVHCSDFASNVLVVRTEAGTSSVLPKPAANPTLASTVMVYLPPGSSTPSWALPRAWPFMANAVGQVETVGVVVSTATQVGAPVTVTSAGNRDWIPRSAIVTVLVAGLVTVMVRVVSPVVPVPPGTRPVAGVAVISMPSSGVAILNSAIAEQEPSASAVTPVAQACTGPAVVVDAFN